MCVCGCLCFYCVFLLCVRKCACVCVCVRMCVRVCACERVQEKGGGVARERFCSRCLFAAGVPTTPRVMDPATREPSPAIICC